MTGRKCRATTGRVEVCDAAYGHNGWLGLASIWVSGDHITPDTVKLNDTYYGSGSSGLFREANRGLAFLDAEVL